MVVPCSSSPNLGPASFGNQPVTGARACDAREPRGTKIDRRTGGVRPGDDVQKRVEQSLLLNSSQDEIGAEAGGHRGQYYGKNQLRTHAGRGVDLRIVKQPLGADKACGGDDDEREPDEDESQPPVLAERP